MMMNRLFGAGCVLALGLLVPAFAADEKKGKDDKPNPAAKNLNRDIARHKEFLKRIEKSKGKGDVIFLGDSITHGWEGQKAWKEYFGEFKPVNLGIGGDQTGHVLWRITEGKELEHLKPKAAVIMIGTNNTGGHSAEQIAGGIKAIVEELKKQKPHIKILVLGVFPRGSGSDADEETKTIPAAKLNKKIPAINAIISKLDDGKTVFYKDIGKEFLTPEGGLSGDIMPDYLHLSAQGLRHLGQGDQGRPREADEVTSATFSGDPEAERRMHAPLRVAAKRFGLLLRPVPLLRRPHERPLRLAAVAGVARVLHHPHEDEAALRVDLMFVANAPPWPKRPPPVLQPSPYPFFSAPVWSLVISFTASAER